MRHKAIPRILTTTNHKSAMPAHWRPCLLFHWQSYPANTQCNKHVIITWKRRFYVIITCLLHCLFAGTVHNDLAVLANYVVYHIVRCAPASTWRHRETSSLQIKCVFQKQKHFAHVMLVKSYLFKSISCISTGTITPIEKKNLIIYHHNKIASLEYLYLFNKNCKMSNKWF